MEQQMPTSYTPAGSVNRLEQEPGDDEKIGPPLITPPPREPRVQESSNIGPTGDLWVVSAVETVSPNWSSASTVASDATIPPQKLGSTDFAVDAIRAGGSVPLSNV
jgi:hypothetical protein